MQLSFHDEGEHHHKHKFHRDLDEEDDPAQHNVHAVNTKELAHTYGHKGKLWDKHMADNTLMITYDVQHNLHYHDPGHPDFHHPTMHHLHHPKEVQSKIKEAKAAIKISSLARGMMGRKRYHTIREEKGIEKKRVAEEERARERQQEIADEEKEKQEKEGCDMLEDEEGYEEEFETEYEDEKFEQVNIEAARQEQGKKQTEESIDFDELQTLSRKFSDQALTDAISKSPVASRKKTEGDTSNSVGSTPSKDHNPDDTASSPAEKFVQEAVQEAIYSYSGKLSFNYI